MTPRAVSEASGILNVCTVPLETMLKSEPKDPVAKDCDVPERPFIEVSIPFAPLSSTNTRLPDASTERTLPLVLVLVAEVEFILANFIPEADPELPEKVEVAPAVNPPERVASPETFKTFEFIVVADAIVVYRTPDTDMLVDEALANVVAPEITRVLAERAVAVVVASVEVPYIVSTLPSILVAEAVVAFNIAVKRLEEVALTVVRLLIVEEESVIVSDKE